MLLLQYKTNKNGKPHLVMRLSAQNQVGLFRFLNKKNKHIYEIRNTNITLGADSSAGIKDAAL